MRLIQRVFICSCLCLASCSTIHKQELNAGFLASRDTDVAGSARFRALGPLAEYQQGDNGITFTAARPFYSVVNDPASQRLLKEYLWPVGMIKENRGETYSRFLVFFSHDFNNTNSCSRKRFIGFPFFYAGRDINSNKYFAVFPIGGSIHEFLGRDEIDFVLFPLYASSSVKDVKTHDILWPIVSWTKGGDVSRFRIFPFYGQSKNKERWTKRFVLWPLWTSVRYEYPDQKGSGFILFPLYGQTKVKGKKSWTFLPPLFKMARGGKNNMELHFPWPIVQYRSIGLDKKFYIWPLWGKKTVGPLRSSFVLWPIIGLEKTQNKDTVSSKFRLLPLFYHEKVLVKNKQAEAGVEGNTPAGAEKEKVRERYFKFWPLFSYNRVEEDVSFQTLALWPLKRTQSIERNWAPIWSLYSHKRAGNNVEDEVLWGLFRRYSDGAGDGRVSLFPLFSSERSAKENGQREWNFLLGLAGYKREGLQKTYKLLYVIKWHTGNNDGGGDFKK